MGGEGSLQILPAPSSLHICSLSNPLHEQYMVNTLYMDLFFLGTRVVNLIQLLCFSPTLWQRKCFLSLKYDKNKFWSPLLCALSVPWCYKKLMANTSVGGVLKILAAHY